MCEEGRGEERGGRTERQLWGRVWCFSLNKEFQAKSLHEDCLPGLALFLAPGWDGVREDSRQVKRIRIKCCGWYLVVEAETGYLLHQRWTLSVGKALISWAVH